ncbi:acyl-CoA thioesterase domain-containing protein [Mycolicibacterium fortuitum]|uniref:acyl-CoA thioesterase domain-containing protein n=1 Tax=Mycolicibacterium fortuitum TaxID=1766 RepID=UPI003558DBFD
MATGSCRTIAHGGWGPTLGGQVVGGLLARAVEALVSDVSLQPARFTVEILRRVASAPVHLTASVVRSGSRMQAVDAVMTLYRHGGGDPHQR